MKEEWHYPPHIVVSEEGVTFGGTWSLAPEAEAEAEPEEEEAEPEVASGVA